MSEQNNLPADNKQTPIEILQASFSSIKETNKKDFELKITESIESYPFVEIEDNKTYEEAKKARTAHRKVRKEIENGDKALASLFSQERKSQKSIATELVEKIKPAEDRQQTEIDRYEEKKAEEKRAKEKAEEERISAIKNKIEEIKQNCKTITEETTFENFQDKKQILDEVLKTEFDFEEFEILFDEVAEEAETLFEAQVNKVTEEEQQRLDQIKKNQESKLRDVKLHVLETIDGATTEDLLSKAIKTFFNNINFDFGPFTEDFIQLKNTSIDKATKKVKELQEQAEKDAEFKRLQDQETERQNAIQAEQDLRKFTSETIYNIDALELGNDYAKLSNDIVKKIDEVKIDNLKEPERLKKLQKKLLTQLGDKLNVIAQQIKEKQEQEKKQKQERIERLSADKARIEKLILYMEDSFKNNSFFSSHSYNHLEPESKEFCENLFGHLDAWLKDVKEAIKTY